MAAGTTIQCPMCSFEYATAQEVCHTGCPLAKHCHWLCCPRCGYRIVDEAHSKASRWLQRLWPGKDALPKDKPTTPIPASAAQQTAQFRSLAEVPTGLPVEILGFTNAAPQHMARFAVLGLMPGATAQVLQRYPAPIIRVDETELALSTELLAKIRVR